MSIWALGLNHQSAPISVRERFAFNGESLNLALRSLHARLADHLHATSPKAEVALLSTCNRTEVYCAAPHDLINPTVAWLAEMGKLDMNALAKHMYWHQSNEAARHVFRVASGLDSMVLGETQILGQFKQAVKIAKSEGVLGSTLSHLFDQSIVIAKEVRTFTDIGAQSVSMPAAGVKLAANLFENFTEISVLLIGAGEMIDLCATYFGAKEPKNMVVANRTMEKGARIAARHGADVMRLSDIPHRLHGFDVVICCTASILPIIGLGAVKQAIKKRRHRPMFMLDLAVPRDIEPEVGELEDVYLYTVDDLARHVEKGLATREIAAREAEVIVDSGVMGFMRWLQNRHHVPLIQELLMQTEKWRKMELDKAKKLIEKGGSIDEAMEVMSRALTQKMLHGALSELNGGDKEACKRATVSINHFFLRSRR